METVMQQAIQDTSSALFFSAVPIRPDDLPSAAEKAYWLLREKIITLEIPPGSAIRDTDFTVPLGIGRTPVREALKRLEVEKFVVSHHRKGTYVKEINLVDIRRQYQVRRQLLTLAVALASQVADPILSQLERKSQYFAANPEKFSLETTFQFVADLELALAKAAGNPFLCYTLQQYEGYARRTCHLLKHLLSEDDLFLDDYPRIMAEVVRNEGERSSQLMALHVDQVHLTIVDKFLERYV